MSLLNYLTQEVEWEKFYQYKVEKSFISTKEKIELRNFIDGKSYIRIATQIAEGTYKFSIPKKKFINKIDSSKKRTVYLYNYDEMMILKFLSYLLSYKYDNFISKNCYSFRINYGVKQAIYNIIHTPNIENMYGYKIDISNYFNSIPLNILLPKLKEFLKEDILLYQLLEQILLDNKVLDNEVIIEENKGIMAGIPISAFLANFYLKDLDEYFRKENVIYARYSDDIILFAEKEDIEKYKTEINNKITQYGLKLNEKKQEYFNPKEKWNFLGFSYENGTIDLAEITIDKIKGKIKRSANSIRRWMIKKKAEPERALKAMNKKFNRKFYSIVETNDLSWMKWYFPVITTDKSLKKVDLYMQQELRFIVTGKHNKKNYEKVPYEELKKCYYRSLVAEYHKFKENKIRQ